MLSFGYATKLADDLPRSLFRAVGGPEHALLQRTEGVYFVELQVSQRDKPDDYHAVRYHASYTVPTDCESGHYAALHEAGYTPDRYHLIRGAIIDNDKDTPVKFLEPSDREIIMLGDRKVYKVRAVFDSLFPASSVRVIGARLVQRT